VTIRLTEEELIMGAMQGVLRRVNAIMHDRRDNVSGELPNEREFDGWGVDIEGALGEMAFAKYRDTYWSGAADFREGDVGDTEVRTTKHRGGSLLLYPTSENDKRFALMIGSIGVYRVAGWIRGKDGKQQKYWREMGQGSGRCAFMVPQDELKPVPAVPF
jgi:hypothetical protein